MILKIISGGQTGADRGALEAAIDRNFPHGGFCPKGRRAEDGVIPPQFQLVETLQFDYPPRTKLNIERSDGTLVLFKRSQGRGTQLTCRLAHMARKPLLEIDLVEVPREVALVRILKWLDENKIETLNVAGSRESKRPGLQQEVFVLIRDLLIVQSEDKS